MMKIRLAMTASFSVILLAVALLWLMDRKVSEERDRALERDLRGSVMSMSRAIQNDVKGLSRSLGFMSSPASVNWASFQPFFAVAQVRIDGARTEVIQFAVDDKGRARSWKESDLKKFLAPSAAKLARIEQFQIMSLGMEGQRPVFGLAWKERNRTWIALTGAEFLQGFLDLQKTTQSVLVVVASSGEILAHSTSEYVGTKIPSGRSMYSQILESPDVRAYKRYEQGETGPVMAASEKVPQTNITLLAYKSLQDVAAARQETLMFGALAALGLCLLSVSGVWWAASRAEPVAPSEPKPVPKSLGRIGGAPAPSLTYVPQPALLARTEPVKAGAKDSETPLRLASALGHELRGPLAAILGQGQLILSSSTDQSVKESTEAILRDARRARGILDKLMIYAGEKETQKKPARIEGSLFKVLKEEQARFQRLHVRVNQQIGESSTVIPLAENDVEKAIRHLVDNAVEAMERMADKELTVRVSEDPEWVHVEVKDNGEGMNAEQADRATEPFYTTRDSRSHLGLGLAAADGIVREHGGRLELKSQMGLGTAVTLSFPKTRKSARIGGQSVSLVTEERVKIPDGLRFPEVKPLELSEEESVAMAPPPLPAAGSETGGAAMGNPSRIDIDQLFSMSDSEATQQIVVSPEDARATADGEAGAPASANGAPKAPSLSAPKFKAPVRKNKLDEVKVAIRRPGEKAE